MKDFSLLRDAKSTRFPHGFMAELEKRLTGVMMGKERRQEYQDAAVKRSFAASLNAFMEAGFKKRMEKDRRVEDLVLIFYSNATRVLQAGKAPGDDSWKLMVDRHVALFVRLVSLVLKEHDWSRDRPELTSRLATLESKLLAHDQDLAAETNALGSSIETVVPLSYDVKDMPLVQVVGRIFGFPNTQVQSDIDRHRIVWTETAALQDLKTYQTLLNTNSKQTLRSDDFDLEEAYELWKKAEAPDLSQMMLAIVQSNPDLAKMTNIHQNRPPSGTSPVEHKRSDSTYSDTARRPLEQANGSSYVLDQPVDMSFMSPTSEKPPMSFSEEEHSFTFIPPDPRSYYRLVLSQALSFDLKDETLHASQSASESTSTKLLSKQSTELLNELCLRWRLPYISRVILFLDVCREKFLDGELTLETLNSAFEFIKEPLLEDKKDSSFMKSLLFDRAKWTLMDFALNQQIISSLHEALLRDLYDVATRCYEPKPPSVGLIMFVLDNHIFQDPSFPKTVEDLDQFTEQLRQGLKEKARAAYEGLMAKHLSQDQESWEFYHVIELGRAVMALVEKIQKRYRKSPEIMGCVRFDSPDVAC